MDDVCTARLERLHEAGRFESVRHAVGLLLPLLFEKVPRVLEVVVTREGEMARHSFEPVAVGVARNRVERLPRIAAREQIKNAEPLLGPRRRVEPRHEALVAGGRLADAEPVTAHTLPVIPSVPDELKVVGFLLRIEKLMRLRKHRELTCTPAGNTR